jgi:glycerol-3-phosphate dehydrogenase
MLSAMSNQTQTKNDNTNQEADFDVVIVGAGINGAVSAAALSAAGQRVLLIDKSDFASFTSQQSSNLVWGGIKYLQSYEFLLVFKLCLARNRLMRSYPNQIKQIGFLASLGKTAPFGRLLGTFGTLFYWGIGLFGTKAPSSFSAAQAKALEPHLITGRKAVRYYDAYLPDTDARFVYDFIRHAKRFGAQAENYTELVGATFDQNWSLRLKSKTGERLVTAKAVVNAAGPFAEGVSELLGSKTKAGLVFSKGVHLTLDRKITKDNQVLAFWDEQGRLFYVLPMGDRSMIGTTDTRVQDPHTKVDPIDREFVLRQINNQLEGIEITAEQIISERSGVRPLVIENAAQANTQDWHQLSRKHVIEVDSRKAVVSVLGGKLTDCLNVGQEVVDEFSRLGFKVSKPSDWFGEGDQSRFTQFAEQLVARCSSASEAQRIAESIWRRHGERSFEILADGQELTDLVPGLGITEQEVNYIIRHEDVVTREDLLRRRLPIAMSRSEAEIAANSKLQALLEAAGL